MNNVDRLRSALAASDLLTVPCCFDAMSAKMIAAAGFPVTLVSGFATSGSRLGLPDTGLMSFGEMRDNARDICGGATDLAVIVDGDTGYGNAINAQRTVREYARIGAACVMIEDQVSPKRCGHTQGKDVVDREEARQRVRAVIEAARKAGILLLARTDARAVLGFEEALDRARMFADEGADIVFIEAPETEDEMARACRAIDRPMMANMISGGKTPFVSPDRLRELGFRLAVYPMVPFAATLHAMQASLKALKSGRLEMSPPQMSFEEIKTIVGFPEYYELERKFVSKR